MDLCKLQAFSRHSTLVTVRKLSPLSNLTPSKGEGSDPLLPSMGGRTQEGCSATAQFSTERTKATKGLYIFSLNFVLFATSF